MKILQLSKILILTMLFNITKINAQCPTKPSSPILIGDIVCENDETAVLKSNLSNTYWYSDIDTSNLLHIGNEYSPISISNQKFYAVFKDDDGCASEISSVELIVFSTPIISLNSISTCFTDTTINLNFIVPSYSLNNQIEWKIFKDDELIMDSTNFYIKPFSKITSSGLYIIQPTYYVKVNDNLTCKSNNNYYANFEVLPCYRKSYLLFLIDSAINLISNAIEIKTLNYYQAGSINELQNQINLSQIVYDNQTSTQNEIDNAAINLKNAISIFHSKEVSNKIIDINNKFEIYPNPANNYLQIITPFERNKVTILNISGKPILTTNKKEIDISKIKTGQYIVKITNNDYIEFHTLIIKK